MESTLDSTVSNNQVFLQFGLIRSLNTISVFVDIGANSGDTANLAFEFTGGAAKSWEIKVNQIKCTDEDR